MFRVETRVLREVTRNKMAEDAESKIAVRFVNENDYKNISTETLFAKQEMKQNRLYWLVSKQPRTSSLNENARFCNHFATIPRIL